jgi:prepilin-type N-terminal cleavage/methylation domain-containing protein
LRVPSFQSQSGLTLVEVLVSLAIFGLIVGVLYQMTSVGLAAWDIQRDRNRLLVEGERAMEEIVRHVRGTNLVLAPAYDGTPENTLSLAEMVLDADQDGFSDSDNNKNGKIHDDPGNLDPVDPVMFYRNSTTGQLIERLPDYATSDLTDYVESAIADHVQSFTVTRTTESEGILLTVSMVLESPKRTFSLNSGILVRQY